MSLPPASRSLSVSVSAAALLLSASRLRAVDGDVRMHDPSTIIQADGKFYVYGTGNGLPAFVSDDGWTWRRAGQVMQAVPGGRPGPEVIAKGGNNTWAPDIIRRFAASSGRNIGPGHFGLLDLGSGVEKFSLHYEADLDRGGVSSQTAISYEPRGDDVLP